MLLAILGSLELYMPLIDLGVTGVLMVLVWRLMVKKDKKSYEMIAEQNEERKEMYQSHSELIQEVTRALVDKNNTDDKMAAAVVRLADELREIDRILTMNHEIMLRLDRSNNERT